MQRPLLARWVGARKVTYELTREQYIERKDAGISLFSQASRLVQLAFVWSVVIGEVVRSARPSPLVQ